MTHTQGRTDSTLDFTRRTRKCRCVAPTTKEEEEEVEARELGGR
jgi:hypothetical protein